MATVASLAAELAAVKTDMATIGTNIDGFFLVINATIIYFMQCGFAFLECGAVRAKNATNILLKNILDSFLGAIAYWIIGWPFAYGEGNVFLGTRYWVSAYQPETLFASWFFQYVFAATASTIVSGAMAERCEFGAYLVYSFLITGFIYPCVSHWAWAPQGWLAQGVQVASGNVTVTVTYQDFAGSGVVHLLGGTASLIGCILLGPRLGRFDKRGRPQPMRGHSVPLAALGGYILFFGFFAFNAGSRASISQPGDAVAIALASVNTILAGSFGAVLALFTQFIATKVSGETHSGWSLLSTINGGLSGMVAICAGADAMEPYAACVTGVVAGLNYMAWSWLMLRLKIDDPLDAIAVHGASGLWGVLAAPLLRKDTGLVYTGSTAAFTSFGWNLAGALAIIGWTAITSVIMFGLLFAFGLLRVDANLEANGLDVPKHGEPAYPKEAYEDGWDPPSCDEYWSSKKASKKRKKERRHSLDDPTNPRNYPHHHGNHDPTYPSHSSNYPVAMYGSGPPLRHISGPQYMR